MSTYRVVPNVWNTSYPGVISHKVVWFVTLLKRMTMWIPAIFTAVLTTVPTWTLLLLIIWLCVWTSVRASWTSTNRVVWMLQARFTISPPCTPIRHRYSIRTDRMLIFQMWTVTDLHWMHVWLTKVTRVHAVTITTFSTVWTGRWIGSPKDCQPMLVLLTLPLTKSSAK